MKCTVLKPSQTTTITNPITGSQLPPPGRSGRRKLGPPPPPPLLRRGPSGPRCLKISSMFAERRGRSSLPPPGSHGLRGPRGASSPVGGVSGSLSSGPSPEPSLLPVGLPQGLRLPAIVSEILSIHPPNRSIASVYRGRRRKKQRRLHFRCTLPEDALAGGQ